MFRWCRQVNASKAQCEMRSTGQWARSSTTICVRVSARCPFSTAKPTTPPRPGARTQPMRPHRACRTLSGQGKGVSADTRQQLKHQQRIGSPGLHVSEGAFLYKQCRCLYTEIGLGAQGQTLSPFLPGQFAFDGGENHCTHEGNDIQAWLKCRVAGSWGILSRKGNGCMTCCSASLLLATISETYTALRHFLTACSPCCQHAVGTRRMQGRTMGETGKPRNLGSNVLSMQTSKKHLNARTSVSLQSVKSGMRVIAWATSLAQRNPLHGGLCLSGRCIWRGQYRRGIGNPVAGCTSNAPNSPPDFRLPAMRATPAGSRGARVMENSLCRHTRTKSGILHKHVRLPGTRLVGRVFWIMGDFALGPVHHESSAWGTASGPGLLPYQPGLVPN